MAHVDDVAAGHLLALEHGRSGRRYVLGGEAMSYARLFACIGEALGRSTRVVTMPEPWLSSAGRAAAWLRGAGLPLPLPLTEGMVTAACAELYYSSRRVEQELGWTHRSAREAVHDGVAWYRRMALL